MEKKEKREILELEGRELFLKDVKSLLYEDELSDEEHSVFFHRGNFNVTPAETRGNFLKQHFAGYLTPVIKEKKCYLCGVEIKNYGLGPMDDTGHYAISFSKYLNNAYSDLFNGNNNQSLGYRIRKNFVGLIQLKEGDSDERVFSGVIDEIENVNRELLKQWQLNKNEVSKKLLKFIDRVQKNEDRKEKCKEEQYGREQTVEGKEENDRKQKNKRKQDRKEIPYDVVTEILYRIKEQIVNASEEDWEASVAVALTWLLLTALLRGEVSCLKKYYQNMGKSHKRRNLEKQVALNCVDLKQCERKNSRNQERIDKKLLCISNNFQPEEKLLFGREKELQKLHNVFHCLGKQQKIVFLTGIGGIGKSVLAKKYASTHENEYDAIVEVYANSIRSVLLLIPIQNQEGLKENVSNFLDKLRVLEQLCCQEKILLIVHDFDTRSLEGMEYLKSIKMDVLFTSRCSWMDSGYPEVRIREDGLSSVQSPNAAKDLFWYYYGEQRKYLLSNSEETKKLEELLAYLEYHPLTIELLAKQMSSIPGMEMTSGEMLTELKTIGIDSHEGEEILHEKDKTGLIPGDARMHLERIFRFAVEKNSLSEKEIVVLRFMLLTGRNGITIEQFQEWTGLKERAYIGSLNQLRLKGWLQGEDSFYRIHLSVAEALYRQEEVHPTMENVSVFLDHYMKRDLKDCKNFIERNWLLEVSRAIYQRMKGDTLEFAEVINRTAVEMNEAQLYLEACYAGELALNIRKKLLGENDNITAVSYNNVGYILFWKLGQREKGLEFQKKALEIWKNLNGENHADTARAYNNVGMCYERLEDWSKGLKYKERALNIWKKLYGDEHEDTARAYSNVGISYEALGNLEKGFEMKLKALELRRKLFGNMYTSTASSCYYVAKSYRKMGKLEKAIELAEESWKTRCALLGEEHSLTIKTKDFLEECRKEIQN